MKRGLPSHLASHVWLPLVPEAERPRLPGLDSVVQGVDLGAQGLVRNADKIAEEASKAFVRPGATPASRTSSGPVSLASRTAAHETRQIVSVPISQPSRMTISKPSKRFLRTLHNLSGYTGQMHVATAPDEADLTNRLKPTAVGDGNLRPPRRSPRTIGESRLVWKRRNGKICG